ncbi:MAG: ketopantoate reductase family protein [Chthoniobacterales bacterium]
MTNAQQWPQIAVVGAGAVGGYFGGMLARAGAPVVLIGRKDFVDTVNRDGLVLERLQGIESIPVKASIEMSGVRDAELILFCVKSLDTVSAAREMAPFVASGVTVVCLQNGVDNGERIRETTAIAALPAAVYVAVSVPRPGHIKHVARGDLIIGQGADKAEQLCRIFTAAEIGCQVSENITGELWVKLLCNCALNAVSALGRIRYGEIANSADAREVMERVVDEVLLVANASGVTLPGITDRKSGMAAAMGIATGMAGALSSTAQDLNRGRLTEIDSLNGYIARKGTELGVDVPVNHALFTLVKLAEKESSGPAS